MDGLLVGIGAFLTGLLLAPHHHAETAPPALPEPSAYVVRFAAPRTLDLFRCSGCDLHGIDLHGADVHGITLSGATLTLADARGANVAGARLSGARLIGADLRNARLDRANLSGAILCSPSRSLWVSNGDVRTDEGTRCADLRDTSVRGTNVRASLYCDGTENCRPVTEADLRSAHLSPEFS